MRFVVSISRFDGKWAKYMYILYLKKGRSWPMSGVNFFAALKHLTHIWRCLSLFQGKPNQTALSTNYKDWTSPLSYFFCSLWLYLNAAHHFLPVLKDLIPPALPPQNAQPLFPLPQTYDYRQTVPVLTLAEEIPCLWRRKGWGVMSSLHSFGSKARSSFNAVLTEGYWESALHSLLCGTGILRLLLHYSNIPELHTWAVPQARQLSLASSQSTPCWLHLKASKKWLLRLKGSTHS